MSEFDYINKTYGLALKRGARVEYSGDRTRTLGTIVSADGQYINVRFDGHTKISGPFHPTWEMRHLVPANPSDVGFEPPLSPAPKRQAKPRPEGDVVALPALPKEPRHG